MSERDEHFMQLAMEEAAKGVGRTSPNPPVGAVVVKKGKAIATGYHRKAGSPHAEIVALQKAKRAAKGATLYVTLEPCSHTGKTPPCVEAIIEAGVKRVVIAIRDPNPLVHGRGVQKLRRNGIEVQLGVLKTECEAFYRAYRTFVTKRRPFVTLKIAASLDGMMATAGRESKWITGPEAREHGHQLRDRVDAILVGRGTIVTDDPRLTARLPGEKHGEDPLRIVLDSQLRIPLNARVIKVRSKAPTVIVTTDAAPRLRERVLVEEGAQVLRCRANLVGQVPLKPLLRKLARLDIMTLLVEGGPEVQTSFLREGLVDRVSIYLAAKLIGGKGLPMFSGLRIPALRNAYQLNNPSCENIGKDLWVVGDL